MKALLSFALVGWFLGVLFFMDRAKASYCGTEVVIINPSLANDGQPIITFGHYNHLPDTSSAFHLLRDSLLRAMSSMDKLKITGNFTQAESQADKNIGLKRANSLRSLFEGYIDLDRIEIESKVSDKVSTAPSFDIQSSLISTVARDKPAPPVLEEQGEVEVVKEKITPIVKKPVILDNGADYIIYFKDESSEIIGSSDVQQYLDALSTRVKVSKEQIEIQGFDDNGRANSESLALAKRRTWRVRKAFSDVYVRRKLVKVINTGQGDPITSNETPEGRSKNRRVEIRIQKKPG